MDLDVKYQTKCEQQQQKKMSANTNERKLLRQEIRNPTMRTMCDET